MEANSRYFELRAEKERQAARQAAERQASDRHIELAKRHDDLVDALSQNEVREEAR